MFDRPFIWFSLMTGLCVSYLGLPLLVIGKAAIEVIIIVLASMTRPTSRAYAKAMNGTSHKHIRRTIHYLSGKLRCIQLLHESAITSILNSEFIQSTVPQHRNARRKRMPALSYRYHRYLPQSRRTPCRQHAHNATRNPVLHFGTAKYSKELAALKEESSISSNESAGSGL
jgi:hypothetical protein